MYVGMAQITVAIGQSQSLKDKRAVIRRIKDRVRDKLGLVVSEVGAQDTWQRAELGCAVASGERRKALELVDEVVRVIAAIEGGAIVAVAKDAMTFDAEPVPVTIDERTGAGDKAAAQDAWVPDAWKDLP